MSGFKSFVLRGNLVDRDVIALKALDQLLDDLGHDGQGRRYCKKRFDGQGDSRMCSAQGAGLSFGHPRP